MDLDAEFKNGPEVAQQWLREIELSSTWEKEFRTRGKKIVERYRSDKETEAKNRFNILYANTEVKKGVIYNRPPTPDVRRRYNSNDPVGRAAADVLAKALSYSIDAGDMDSALKDCVQDALLPGRGTLRIRYKPTFQQAQRQTDAKPMGYSDDGTPQYAEDAFEQNGQMFVNEQYDQLVYEEVYADYVEWEWVRFSPCRKWSQLRWVAFGELLTREELIEQFGDTGRFVKLDYSDQGKADDEGKKALVWMIWNKLDRKVYVISSGYEDGAIAVVEDPLRLEQFFPIPKPLAFLETTNKFTPVPEFLEYQAQANELDRITSRIAALTDALKLRGIYDAGQPELRQLATASDNELIPVNNYAALSEKGGLPALVQWMDIKQIAEVLSGLYVQRDQVKSVIYEITGISDILRGDSDSKETATAQSIKAQYGNSRIGPQQQNVQYFARDAIRLMAEVIAEHFDPQTLAAMTGVELATAEQKQQAVMQAQQSGDQQAMADAQGMVTWDDVVNLLRNEKLRCFRIDVETDSTIAPDDQAEKANVAEMIEALGSLSEKFFPAVQSGAMSFDFFKSLLLFAMRRFRASKEIEEQIENMRPPQPPQPDPNETAKNEAEIEGKKLDNQGKAIELQTKQAELQRQDVELKAARSETGTQEAVMAIAQQVAQMGQTVQQLVNMISGPKAIIRDENGVVIGVKQGGVTQRIARGPDGRIAGIAPEAMQ